MRRFIAVALVSVAAASIASAQPRNGHNFVAPLSSEQEVPANDSRGTGVAHFRLDEDGLHYKLNVANIHNVVASHIHLAPEGQNGPVVAFLFGPAAPGGGPSNGNIAEGVITAANLVGPLAGEPLHRLIAEIIHGRAYVNVHTNDGVAPSTTGPGDFPGGEIRGQIKAPSHRGEPIPPAAGE